MVEIYMGVAALIAGVTVSLYAGVRHACAVLGSNPFEPAFARRERRLYLVGVALCGTGVAIIASAVVSSIW